MSSTNRGCARSRPDRAGGAPRPSPSSSPGGSLAKTGQRPCRLCRDRALGGAREGAQSEPNVQEPNEKEAAKWLPLEDLRNSGGRIRTYDLRVMSPTSYQTALPRNLWNISVRPDSCAVKRPHRFELSQRARRSTRGRGRRAPRWQKCQASGRRPVTLTAGTGGRGGCGGGRFCVIR